MLAASCRLNVADRLAAIAQAQPDVPAVASTRRGRWRSVNFGQLDAEATAAARTLVDLGVRPGMRLALLVPPSPEFVTLVFALLRSGATTILVDPGMGRKHLVSCLAAAQPEGFVAVSRAQAARIAFRRHFPKARINVTVGRRWFWRGPTLRQLLAHSPDVSRDAESSQRSALPATRAADPAAIIFTSGSTGPPKGVLYTHEMFDAQAAEIQRQYDLQPGGADLACFALFGLFNAATGVTTVFPDMDFSRPASADPRKLLAAANTWQVTQAFASPTVWDKLSRHCETTGERIPTLRKVFSCGAPVRAEVIARTLQFVAAPGDAEMHTPYGATEALPVSTIEAKELFGVARPQPPALPGGRSGVARPESAKGVVPRHEDRTTPFGKPQGVPPAQATAAGAGVCVGRKFDTIDWRVIRITDEPIASIDAAEELPIGEIGELIVRGPQVSISYLPVPSPRRGGLGRGVAGEENSMSVEGQPPSPALPARGRGPEETGLGPNAVSKIRDGATTWHRMGDVGYLDEAERFWYCGRKSQRVETATGPLYTECVEVIVNQQANVRRSALVGLGPRGSQTPVIVVETLFTDLPRRPVERLSKGDREQWRLIAGKVAQLVAEAFPHVKFGDVLLHQELPVDVRHNAKINREALAAWAVKMLADKTFRPMDDPRMLNAQSAPTKP